MKRTALLYASALVVLWCTACRETNGAAERHTRTIELGSSTSSANEYGCVVDCVAERPLCGDPPDGGDPYTDRRDDGAQCGGGYPHCACPDGKHCLLGRDCTSSVCTGGSCQQSTCHDGVKNGDESDVDCGGPCSPCATGQVCADAWDCESGRCSTSGDPCTPTRCLSPSCGDGVKNGGETDVDCGGSCSPCADGKLCERDSDCISGLCQDAFCRVARCGNGVMDGDESDVDCGGALCEQCVFGRACQSNNDCATDNCLEGRCSPPRDRMDCGDAEGFYPPCVTSCGNGVQDGAETDVDCGGPDCDPCETGLSCQTSSDCQSHACSGGSCQPSCTDGFLNGDETDIDCGGTCPSCPDDLACHQPADCISRICTPAGDDNYCGIHQACFEPPALQPRDEPQRCHDQAKFLTARLRARKPSGTTVLRGIFESGAKLLVWGERHQPRKHDYYVKWIKGLRANPSTKDLNCFFWEFPKNAETEKVFKAFQEDNKSWKDTFDKYGVRSDFKDLVVGLRNEGIKVYPVDHEKAWELGGEIRWMESRNVAMANNINGAIGGCTLSIMLVGQGHIEDLRTEEKIKSLPEALADVGVRDAKNVLIEDHSQAFAPRPPGSTFREPDAECKYIYDADKYYYEWGFDVPATTLQRLGPSGDRVNKALWSAYSGYIQVPTGRALRLGDHVFYIQLDRFAGIGQGGFPEQPVPAGHVRVRFAFRNRGTQGATRISFISNPRIKDEANGREYQFTYTDDFGGREWILSYVDVDVRANGGSPDHHFRATIGWNVEIRNDSGRVIQSLTGAEDADALPAAP